MAARLETVVSLADLKAACGTCCISEICLPRGLSSVDIAKFSHVIKPQRPLDSAEHLFRAGDSFRSLYIVRSGSFKTYVATADGHEQITGFNLPGELLGLDGFENQTHTCNVVALERAHVCTLAFDRFEEVCCQLPSLRRQLLRLIGKEITSDHMLMLTLNRLSAEQRIAAFLLSLSARLKVLGYSETEFTLSMAHHEIANYLGLAPETVSRILNQFHKGGLVSVHRRKHVCIQNLAQLQAVLGYQCWGTLQRGHPSANMV